MSGFEVAGLALGAFPLLLEGAKGLQNQFKKAEFYWKFRNRFEDFLQEIERQSIAYDQNLRSLLSQLNLTSDEQAKLLDVEDQQLYDQWRKHCYDERVNERFKKREVEWLAFELAQVQEALQGLRGLLSTHQAYRIDSHDFKSERFKMTTSFFSEKDELITRLKQGNQHIYNFVEGASRLQPPVFHASRSHSRHSRTLKNLQRQAKSLYQCFQRHWSCGCEIGHPCGVTIQKTNKDFEKNCDIVVMFNLLRLRVEVKDTIPSSSREMGNMESTHRSDQDELTRLTQQVTTKNAWRRFGKSGKTVKKLIKSTTATATFAVLPQLASKGLRNDKEKHPRKPKKTRFWWRRRTISLSCLKFSSSRTEKEARTSVSCGVQNNPDGLGVRFDVTEDHATEISGSDMGAKTLAIQNLCQSITCGSHQSCLGYLDGDDQTRVYLHVEAPNPISERRKVDSLDSALKQGVRYPERLRIALTIALLVGAMGNSPWLKPDWTSEDLCLWTDSEHLAYQPYFLHSSLLNTLHKTPKPNPMSQGRSNLYRLGIVLLEMVFGKRLKDQPIRKDYMKDEIPNELTDYCTAVVWQTEVENEVGCPIADGIGWCLTCLHGPPQDIGSPECLNKLWQNVINPLEVALKSWSRDPIS